MKKIIASILCVLMVLTSMSFSALAYIEIKNDRAINIYVDKTEVYADGTPQSIVTVTVKVEGRSDLANAQYTMVYDPALFELQETEKDPGKTGMISEMFYKEGGTYTDGEELTKYTFKAIPQVAEETGDFFMQEAFTYTYMESIDAEKFEASSEGKSVTILLMDYDVKKYIDGNLIDETQGEVDEVEYNYDDATHSFEVETVPDATVEYTVKFNGTVVGTDLSEVEFKEEGTYVIEYVVTDKENGYAPVEGDFTIIIKEPVYVVEVVEDYVFADATSIGKNLVLVYTNTTGVGFNYGTNVMVDVSTSDYDYKDVDPYDYVYAFVTDPIANGEANDYQAYKDQVSHWYNGMYTIPEVGVYNTDLNYNNDDEMQDISVLYGVMNGYPGYFADVKYQRNILKADVSQNKRVNGEDAADVVFAVKN